MHGQAANDDHHASEQALNVALHARYLLALKGHRRGAYVAGFVHSAFVVSCFWYFGPRLLTII